MRFWVFYIIFAFGLVGGDGIPGVYAQESGSTLQLTFNRQNNFTYTTRLDISYALKLKNYRLEARLHHDNLFNSSRKKDPFIQLYARSSIWQFYRINPKVEIASWINTTQFFTTQNQRYNVYFGAHYKPFPYLQVTPVVGYSWDYRSRILDQGISPALLLKSAYTWKDGLTMETELFALTKFIQPRHQRNVIFSSRWARDLGESAGVSFGATLGSNQMDDYKSKSIERIKADTVGAELGLRYKLFPGIFWDSQSDLTFSRRQFDYEVFSTESPEFNDLRFNQLDFATRHKVSFGSGKFGGYFLYRYQYLGRRYELENSRELPDREYDKLLNRERQKDYFRNLSQLELNLQYTLNPLHTLHLTGTNRYLQYDTPSEETFDDHDELNYGLAMEWKGRWTQKFSTQYKLIGTVRRYAFLFAERSQDNYTQRNLRMEFNYQWNIMPRLNLRGQQFVYVTYNVKDFEDRNFTDRSTRNLESRLDLNYRPFKRLNSRLSFYRKEVHVSYLNWEKFSETTLDTTITMIAEQINEWQLKTSWKNVRLFVDVGYKHFSQLRYLNTSMTNLQNLLVPINLHIRNYQTGPVTQFRFFHRRPASAELSLWWQIQYQDFKFKEIDELTTLSTNYREEILRQNQINFRPFIRLQMNILLAR